MLQLGTNLYYLFSMKSKTLIIMLLVVCFLCFGFCAAVSLLFGAFEANNECVYKGPLASKTSEMAPACNDDAEDETEDEDEDSEDSDSNEHSNGGSDTSDSDLGLESYSNTYYSVKYPSDWYFTEAGNTIQISKYDPNNTPEGELNDNFNVRTIIGQNDTTSWTKTDCQDTADSVVDSLVGVFESIEVSSVELTTINSNKACKVIMYGTLGGYDLDLYQYYVIDAKNTKNAYVLTFEMGVYSDNLDTLEDISESFKTL